MRALIDTSAFLWFISGDSRLSHRAKNLISDIDNEIKLLPIERDHLKEVVKLPFLHRDPFDRLIISQGIVENLPIITCDRLFSDYLIEKVW